MIASNLPYVMTVAALAVCFLEDDQSQVGEGDDKGVPPTKKIKPLNSISKGKYYMKIF